MKLFDGVFYKLLWILLKWCNQKPKFKHLEQDSSV